MSILSGFPILSQLADVQEPNRQYDCVPTCIAACLEYLLGKPFDGGAIKDAVYGKDYVGGTAASQYVGYCQEQGIKLSAVNGEPAQLISQAHTLLAEQKPTLITIPDPYMPANSGWTHVEAFHADSPGGLTALDPYGGKDITKSDAEWTGLLQDSQIWVLERITMFIVPQGWSDDGRVLRAPDGTPVVDGFRDHVGTHNWRPTNTPTGAQYYTDQLEMSNTDLGGGDQQMFRESMLGYPHNPTGASAHLKDTVIEEYVGTELQKLRSVYAPLYSAYQQQKAQIAQLQSQQPPDQSGAISQYQNALAALSSLNAQAATILANPLKS